jgi:hypothetical protein
MGASHSGTRMKRRGCASPAPATASLSQRHPTVAMAPSWRMRAAMTGLKGMHIMTQTTSRMHRRSCCTRWKRGSFRGAKTASARRCSRRKVVYAVLFTTVLILSSISRLKGKLYHLYFGTMYITTHATGMTMQVFVPCRTCLACWRVREREREHALVPFLEPHLCYVQLQVQLQVQFADFRRQM